MASTIDLSGLKHFMDRVQNYGNLLKDFRNAMELICEDARRYAESEYAQYGHSDITVSYDNGGTMATIYARGEQVAFFEFGTGDVGNGTYPDTSKIPQSGVPITSSWVYYYDSPAKRTSHGVRGWFWDNKFRKGNQAEAEMWKTSQYIQTRARQIIQAYFKAESGG
jgi:hypothetical protein